MAKRGMKNIEPSDLFNSQEVRDQNVPVKESRKILGAISADPSEEDMDKIRELSQYGSHNGEPYSLILTKIQATCDIAPREGHDDYNILTKGGQTIGVMSDAGIGSINDKMYDSYVSSKFDEMFNRQDISDPEDALMTHRSYDFGGSNGLVLTCHENEPVCLTYQGETISCTKDGLLFSKGCESLHRCVDLDKYQINDNEYDTPDASEDGYEVTDDNIDDFDGVFDGPEIEDEDDEVAF